MPKWNQRWLLKCKYLLVLFAFCDVKLNLFWSFGLLAGLKKKKKKIKYVSSGFYKCFQESISCLLLAFLCNFITLSALNFSRGESPVSALTPEQITFGATDLWSCPLGRISPASDSSLMWQWRAFEGAGLLQEEITHLSAAESAVRVIRQRKYGRGKQTRHSSHITWLLQKAQLYQGTRAHPRSLQSAIRALPWVVCWVH